MFDKLFILLGLLFIKHWYVDFVNQTQEEINNKGTYGNLDGLAHSAKHGLGTIFVLMLVGVDSAVAVVWGALDMIIHYHIDWAKTNINDRFGWGPNTHEEFWWLLGLDQFLHYLTYIAIIGWAVGAF